MRLKHFKFAILTAPGNKVDIKGQVSMMVITIGIKCIAEMVVADIDLGCYSEIGLPEDK